MLRKTRLDLPTDAERQFSNEADASAANGNACLVVIWGTRLGTRIALDNAQTTTRLDSICDFRISVSVAVADYGFEIERQPRKITISIGVACWSPEIISTSDLLRQVDEHLYQAKTRDRNRVC